MPVSLLHEAVVILAVWSRAGELLPARKRPLLAMPIDKLASGIRMPFKDGEWDIIVNLFHACNGRSLSFVPLGAPRAPERGHISSIHRIYEISRYRVAAMSDGINLQRACRRIIPRTTTNGNHGEDVSRLCRAPAPYHFSDVRKPPHPQFHEALTHPEEFGSSFCIVSPHPVPCEDAHILGNQRVKILAAWFARCFPDIFQRGNDVRSILSIPAAPFTVCRIAHLHPPE